jgi:hypothetical protein
LEAIIAPIPKDECQAKFASFKNGKFLVVKKFFIVENANLAHLLYTNILE